MMEEDEEHPEYEHLNPIEVDDERTAVIKEKVFKETFNYYNHKQSPWIDIKSMSLKLQ